MIKLAVIGNPIDHSLSPSIHAAFAKQVGFEVDYRKILTTADQFEKTIQSLVAEGYCGVNITAPFKEQAFELATELSERAQRAQSVNTLHFVDGEMKGDNTDGVGLVKDLVVNKGIGLSGASVLLLGAGGAAKGVFHALLAEHPKCIHVANRSPLKSEAMTQIVAIEPGKTSVSSSVLLAIPQCEFDLVIDASSSLDALNSVLTQQSPSNWARYYNLRYNIDLPDSLNHCISHDGMGMLIEQAAESFCIWTGRRPDTRPLLSEMRRQ